MLPNKQNTIITVVVVALVTVLLADVFTRTIVNMAIHGEFILRTAMKMQARELVKKNANDLKNTFFIGWWLGIFEDWEDREIEALQITGDFIDDEISNESLYIKILNYPEWGLGWCITRYKFELRWQEDDSVATFRINLSSKDRIDVKLNEESEFIATLHEKVK